MHHLLRSGWVSRVGFAFCQASSPASILGFQSLLLGVVACRPSSATGLAADAGHDRYFMYLNIIFDAMERVAQAQVPRISGGQRKNTGNTLTSLEYVFRHQIDWRRAVCS